jgi:hypothetical protein
MEFLRHRILSVLFLAFAASSVCAQQDPDRFPAAAMGFLDTELPAMEKAVTDKDRDYFEDAMSRMLDFSDAWGFKTHANPALVRFSMCTEAVSDFLVVGLCRFKLSPETCEPLLTSNFDANLKRCRELAARN